MAASDVAVLAVLLRVRLRRRGDPLSPSAIAAVLGCAGLWAVRRLPSARDALDFTAAATLMIALAGVGATWLLKERR